MKTRVYPGNAEGIALAAQLLRKSCVVAFPTETVYGLGALATDAEAVKKIFAAKDRAADNPLIVHVSDIGMARSLCSGWDARAQALAQAFWPGPLSLILSKKETIPDVVSAGLPSVALRCPAHPVAQALIRAVGPIAAPSANRSGKPSPTCAQHVYDDLSGRIELILEGGDCERGLESTVLSLVTTPPTLFRPGGISLDQLQNVVGCVQISAGVGAPVAAGERVASPGLLHKHYAPKAQVILWEGPVAAQISEILKRYDALLREGARPIILWMGESPTDFEEREAWVPYQGAREYYGRLRQADDEGYSHVLLGGIHPADAALYNRALRSAGFNRVRV